MSLSILELQKERYFEHLTAKYWNNSAKTECSNADDAEGITLESLGGVFIATLFGLALAMITLAIEVVYYKRREAREAAIIRIKPVEGNIVESSPPPVYEPNESMKVRTFAERARFGTGEMANVSDHVSFVSVYPRKSIHGPRDSAADGLE